MLPEENKQVILDASAFLAVAQREPGAEWVIPHLPHAWMSAVNLSEVVTILSRRGLSAEGVVADVQQLLQGIVPFDRDQALLAASLDAQTRSHGLSLGDRACLALGMTQHCQVITADTVWAKLDLDIPILLIREPSS